MDAIGAASKKNLDAQAALDPMCRQHQECVGWGADPVTGSPVQFPALHLTYNNPSRKFHNKREPEQAQVAPVQNPNFALDTEALPTINDFVDYVNTHFSGASPPEGSNGIYGTSFGEVFQSFYQRPGDKALTVSQASCALVHMALPFDPVTNTYDATFDKCCNNAVQSLPPPPSQPGDNATVAAWWKENGDLYRSFFEKFGANVVVSGSLGGLVELYSSWGTPLLEEGFDKQKLQTNAEIDFTTTTGLGGHTGTTDPMYRNDTALNPLTCVGGDPSKCNHDAISSGAWADSTQTAAALLTYKVVPLSEFLDATKDAAIKQSLETAAEQYVAEMQKQ
jgi:hypothetical protein